MAAQDWTSGYPCKLCDMVCPDMSSLLDHIESHDQEDDRKYKCDECGRCYRHASSLTNHKKTHDVGSFECDICGKENSNASALKSHMRSHTSRKKHTCSQCGKAFRLASQLATHEKMHLTKEVRSYQNVNLESPTMEDGSHYENEESTSDVTVTKNSPAVKSELVNTPRSEASDDAGDRPYKCDLCDKSYIHLRSLANHKKTHQVGTFECEICFKTLSNMAALYSHQRSHKTRSRADQRSLNGSFTGPTCDQLSPPSPETSVHFCHLCQVVLTNEEDFQEHIQIHNSADPCELEETMPDPLSSMVPYNHSVSSPDYTPHLTNSNPSEELQHFDLPQEHTVVNGHHIPHCDNSESPSSQDSQVEANSVDSNRNNPTQSHDETQGASAGDDADRPFKCQICGKSYRHSGSLINHKRSHQTGIFNCPICRKSYPHLAALKGHLRLHKSQSPYFSGRTDWLSSEPLTQEHHQQSFSSQVNLKVGLADECASQDDNCEGEMHHEQFGQGFAEGPAEQPPDDNRHVQRHMCADCGETFADIAGIKSHRCPLMQQQDSNCSKYEGAVDFHQTNGHSVYENPQFGHQGDVDEQSYMLHDKMRKELMNESEDDADLYHCSLCGNNYTSMRALKTHLRGHTQSQENAGSSQPVLMGTQEEVKEDAVGEMMICSTCGGSFDNRQDLMTHQQQHHSQQVHNKTSVNVHRKPRRKKSQTVICGSCGILCTSLHQLKNHGCTRAGINKSVDVKQEVSVEDVVQHEVIRHMNYNAETGDRQYKCDQCGRSYRHAGSLLNHKKSHKTGIYRCLVCQKRFYNLLALKNHQRSHFDVKRYACTECGKAFKIQKQLLNHQRRHKENQAKIQELNSHIQTLKQMNQGSPVGGMSSVTQRATQTVATMQRSMLQDSKDKTTVRIKSENAEDQRPFACDQCGRTYRHAGSLVNHKNSHKTGEYYCSICSNSYSNQLALKNHLRTHLAYKRHSCMKCGKCFRLRKQLASHVCRDPNTDGVPRRSSRSQGHRCKRCKQTFASAEQLSTHVCDDSSANANKDERIFTCNICNRSYRHAGSLLNHKNTHKTGHFGCSFCSKSFTNPMALRNHIRTHTQKKKYVCLTCGKAFRLASILHNHQKIHDRSDAYFSCSTCGKSFQGRSGLKRHRCHRGPLALHTESPDKCFTCDLCGRSYRHAGSLLNHKKTHSENLHHCALCLQTFPDAVTLQIHSQMRRHCCPECGKTFCLLSHLQSHMEGHSKDRSLVCSTCDRSFSNAGSYQQHLETHQHNAGDKGIWPSGAADEVSKQEPPMLSHLDGQQDGDAAGAEEKSHVCEHCGRTYRHAGSLLNHKNSHKTGSFFCSVCQKEFTNLMALKNHRRIHMEPKRYQCLDCGKAFRVSTQLICHRRIHTKEKPFACLLCDKSFSSKSNLRHHQKLHQNSQNYDSSFSVDANSYMDLDMGSFL